MIYRVKQIKGLDRLSRKERRALFNKNYSNIYNHWHGWLGNVLIGFFILLLAFNKLWLPQGVSRNYRILIFLAMFLIVVAIYRVFYLSTIAPYIRRDLELMSHKDLQARDGKNSELDFPHDGATKHPPGL